MTRMTKELLDRRQYCLTLSFSHDKPVDWISEVAEKFNVPSDTVWHDWENRKEWIPFVNPLNDNERQGIIKAAMDWKKRIFNCAFKLYLTDPSGSIRIAALKLMNDVAEQFVEHMGGAHNAFFYDEYENQKPRSEPVTSEDLEDQTL